MLENLNPRERLMVKVIAACVPLFGLIWGVTSFSQKYFANRSQISALRNQIGNEQDRQAAALFAQERRSYYRERSLPADLNVSKIDYGRWLNSLVDKSLTLISVTPTSATTMGRYKGKNRAVDVYEQQTFAVKAKGTLRQVIEMLRQFQELDLMHRVVSLKVTPETSGPSGSGDVRTGKLIVDFRVEAIALADADLTREDFLAKTKTLPETSTQWQQTIIARNIFGPANNPPSVSISPSEFETNESIAINLRGSDPDEQDNLKFELVSSELPELVLEQKEEGKSGKLVAPALSDEKAGEYKLTVRVIDSGMPEKTTEKTFTVDVRKPKPREIVEKQPEPPPFQYAKTAKITAIVQGKDDSDWKCIVEVLALNQIHELKRGDSFELDQRKWIAREIERREVVFEVDNELLTFRGGATLDSPSFRFPLNKEKDDKDSITTSRNDDDQ